MGMLDKLLGRLTDNYRKDPDSNVYKVMNVISGELQSLKDTLMVIETVRDVDIATGETLDSIGNNFGEIRGSKPEELYRQYIKTRMRANLSGGEMETLIGVLNVFFSGNLKSIQESWCLSDGSVYDGEPANVVITFYSTPNLIPYDAIDRVVAGGVGAYYFNEEVRDRFLALNTEINQWESFYKKSGVTHANDTINNLSEGGIGPSGRIYRGEMALESKESENGEIMTRHITLQSKPILYESISDRVGTFNLNQDTIK